MTYERTCPICSETLISTNTYGLIDHILRHHPVVEIVRELLRLWEIVSTNKVTIIPPETLDEAKP